MPAAIDDLLLSSARTIRQVGLWCVLMLASHGTGFAASEQAATLPPPATPMRAMPGMSPVHADRGARSGPAVPESLRSRTLEFGWMETNAKVTAWPRWDGRNGPWAWTDTSRLVRSIRRATRLMCT